MLFYIWVTTINQSYYPSISSFGNNKIKDFSICLFVHFRNISRLNSNAPLNFSMRCNTISWSDFIKSPIVFVFLFYHITNRRNEPMSLLGSWLNNGCFVSSFKQYFDYIHCSVCKNVSFVFWIPLIFLHTSNLFKNLFLDHKYPHLFDELKLIILHRIRHRDHIYIRCSKFYYFFVAFL